MVLCLALRKNAGSGNWTQVLLARQALYNWAISLASTIYSFELPSIEMFSYTENHIDPNYNVYHCILLVYDSEVLMGLTHEKMNQPNKSDPESHSGREWVLFHVEVTLWSTRFGTSRQAAKISMPWKKMRDYYCIISMNVSLITFVSCLKLENNPLRGPPCHSI